MGDLALGTKVRDKYLKVEGVLTSLHFHLRGSTTATIERMDGATVKKLDIEADRLEPAEGKAAAGFSSYLEEMQEGDIKVAQKVTPDTQMIPDPRV